jgi:hypothetical protein
VELEMIQEKKEDTTKMHNKERRNGEARELING